MLYVPQVTSNSKGGQKFNYIDPFRIKSQLQGKTILIVLTFLILNNYIEV